MVFLLTLSGLESHKNSYIRLLISFNKAFGTGNDINKWISLGKNKVFISVILPKGVNNLLFQFPISFLIFCNVSVKLICGISFRFVEKCSPSMENSVLPHSSLNFIFNFSLQNNLLTIYLKVIEIHYLIVFLIESCQGVYVNMHCYIFDLRPVNMHMVVCFLLDHQFSGNAPIN